MIKINKRKKEKQKKLRNKMLCKKYPFLIPRNRFTGKIVKDYDYSFTEYDDLEKGWQIGFGKFLLEDLRLACEKTNFLHDLRIMQLKEKFGSMRLYVNGVPQEIHDVIRKYEYISECVCIECGSPKAQVVNDYGWYLPLCKNCWGKGNKKREQNAIKRGYNFNPVPWSEVAGEDSEFPMEMKYGQYSKEKGEETVTVDISDVSNRILKAYEKRLKKNEKMRVD